MLDVQESQLRHKAEKFCSWYLGRPWIRSKRNFVVSNEGGYESMVQHALSYVWEYDDEKKGLDAFYSYLAHEYHDQQMRNSNTSRFSELAYSLSESWENEDAALEDVLQADPSSFTTIGDYYFNYEYSPGQETEVAGEFCGSPPPSSAEDSVSNIVLSEAREAWEAWYAKLPADEKQVLLAWATIGSPSQVMEMFGITKDKFRSIQSKAYGKRKRIVDQFYT